MVVSFPTAAAVAPTQKVRRPKAEGYNLRIGNVWYRTVAGPQAQILIGTRDSLAQRIDQNSSIYQNVLDIGYAWSRTDLSGGEGLDWDPRQIALDTNQVTLDPIRYWDSDGIDVRRPEVAGNPYVLRLAPTTRVRTDALIDPKDLGASSSFIYLAQNEEVVWYDSWDNITPAGQDIPSPGNDNIALAVAPNDTVMVTNVDGVTYVKETESATFSPAYTPTGILLDSQGIWYVNGRFILSTWDQVDNAQLIELSWDGTDWQPEAAIDSASAPFISVVESGPAIVAACLDGTVRSYTPNNASDGDMGLIPKSRTTMPEGESPILLGANAGVLLIMTTADRSEVDRQEIRIYQAEVLDARFDYVVGQLQLRREWFGAEHEPLVTRNMTNTRDEILFFVKEEIRGTLEESLWRFDVVTTGLSRIVSKEDINLNGITIFDSITGAIDFTNDEILLVDENFHQTFGYMIFPNMSFGLNTDIAWLTTVIEAYDLSDSGAQVELYRSTKPDAILDPFDTSWILVQRLSNQAQSGIEEAMVNVKSRTLALQLRIKASQSDSVSPKVTLTAVRGIPAHRDFIMMVPINISDYVSTPGRRPNRVAGLGNRLHSQVLDLVGSNVEVVMLDPPVLFRGVVNNISEPIEYLAERGSVTRYVMMELRGQRLSTTATPTGDDGMGLGLLGIATVGLGQTEGT